MSKIFVSCGQASAEELKVADDIDAMLRRRGFDCYVAKKVTTILEINADIIRELKNSDGYLFVNFRREKLPGGDHRGSLFSAQEFAIAYALGFDRILIVNQTHLRREGLLGYIACNTAEFETYAECVPTVEKALDDARWDQDQSYSRRLAADGLRLSEPIRYASGHIGLFGRMLYTDIHNRRPDIAALETTGRLVSFKRVGASVSLPCEIRSPLKAAGRPGYSHTIFPKSHEAFDMLCIGQSPTSLVPNEEHLYLNSALDLRPTPYLPIEHGDYEFHYEFYSIDFPVLTVCIRLSWPKSGLPSASILSQQCV